MMRLEAATQSIDLVLETEIKTRKSLKACSAVVLPSVHNDHCTITLCRLLTSQGLTIKHPVSVCKVWLCLQCISCICTMMLEVGQSTMIACHAVEQHSKMTMQHFLIGRLVHYAEERTPLAMRSGSIGQSLTMCYLYQPAPFFKNSTSSGVLFLSIASFLEGYLPNLLMTL